MIGFISLRGLVDFEHFESRSIAYIWEMVFIVDVLDVNWEAGVEFFKKILHIKLSIVISYVWQYKCVFMAYVCQLLPVQATVLKV